MHRFMKKMINGNLSIEEVDKLVSVTKQVEGHTICALGDAAARPKHVLLRQFRNEEEKRK